MRFLETKEAVPILVRFFENGPPAAQEQLRAGLFVSPYRKEVMAALENSVADPDRPVTYYFLATPMELEQLRRLGPTPLYTAKTPEEIKRWVEEVEGPRRDQARAIEREYFTKLAEAVTNKQGQALAVSLYTLISRGPQPAAPALIKALTGNFAMLPEFAQQMLLTSEWSKIAFPYGSSSGTRSRCGPKNCPGPHPARGCGLQYSREQSACPINSA